MSDPLKQVKPPSLRALYEQARSLGCEVTFTSKGNVKVIGPGVLAYGPRKSGDWRGEANTRAMLRRQGLAV